MKTVFIAASILAAALLESAETPSLPGDGFLPGWQCRGPVRVFAREELFNHIDGGAEIFLEFGFRRLQVQRYVKDTSEVTLEVYEMESPEAGLAIYLQKRGKEKRIPGLEIRHSADPYQLTAYRGRWFLQVSNGEGTPEMTPVMTAMVQAISPSIPEETASTPLDSLPAPGRIVGSEILIRGLFTLQNLYTLGSGDILGLSGKTWAAAADYRSPGRGTYTTILVPYADAGQALAAFDRLKTRLDPYLKILAVKENEIVFRDFSQEFGRVELQGERLWIRIRMKSENE